MMGKMVDYRSKKYLSAILYIYKTQIMREIEYSLNAFLDAAQSSISNLDKIQNLLTPLMVDGLFSPF